jgi:hypothetical protein
VSLARRRFLYLGALLAVLAIGLFWRSPHLPFSPFLRKYGADALWALLVYLLLRFIRPSAKATTSAAIAFAFAVFIEFTQLYHAPWIDSLRDTRLGALILGSIFNWPDIPAYAAGSLIGLLIERGFQRKSPAS